MVKIEPEFQKAFDSYLETKGLDKKTKESYSFFYNKFVNIYTEITQKNIDAFLTHNPHTPTRAMIKNLISAIKRWDSIPEETKQKIGYIDIPQKTSKTAKKEPKFIKRSEINVLDMKIKSNKPFEDEMLKIMILVQFYGGLRLNELINLSFEDLKFNEWKKEEEFQAIKISSESAKFGKARLAYIPTDVYLRLLRWYKRSLLTDYNKQKDTSKPIWKIKSSAYKHLFNKWTLEILGERYNTHSLRHGRGYNLVVDEKQPIEIVKKYLGHADIKSTQLYIHVGDREVKEALEKGSIKKDENK